jgi:4,5:9,10-diseco-3-hydroxy-5,9,17-trioxoandrosta-1(10),2-diene-4-oate hydrolase
MPKVTLAGGELDGLELSYLVDGQGPATLLIHGLGGFAASWRHTIAALSSHGQVVALDLPGFGQSAKPRRRYDLAFLAGTVDGFLRALDIDRVRLVAHSLGGAVAAAFALAFPDRVERLALVSPVIPGFPLRPSMVYRVLALPGIGDLVARAVTRRMCAAALDRCFFSAHPEEVAFLVDHQFEVRASAGGRGAYLATLRGARRDFAAGAPAYRAALGRWTRPALVIHGRQDRVVPVAHAEAVAGGLPTAVMRVVDQCGHFPQIEHARAVNEWLGEFLFAGAAGR